jgi:molybdopterin molybdotransferase
MQEFNATLAQLAKKIEHYNAKTISVLQAQKLIQDFIVPMQASELVNIFSALGRVLAEDIFSPIDVPAHDNSAMDGYAFDGKSIMHDTPLTLKIVGKVLAGHPFRGEVKSGECVHIMTGAVMPPNCDTVIPQEFTSFDDGLEIQIAANKIAAGDNRRAKGEDLAKGQIALAQGRLLSPADLGLIASLGFQQVAVKARLKVAYFSTGDEIRSSGENLEEGSVYDSNRYTIYGMLSRLGCEVIDMGVVPDNPDSLEQSLRLACEKADAVITSGGVSVGAADYTKQIMAKLGEVEFWTIGMRPGRPMAFGKITSNDKSAYLFGLPGNPVAVMVTFYFFARNALYHLMGAKPPEIFLVPAIAQHKIKKRQGRTEYQRGIVTRNQQGQLEVKLTGSQGSGILRSMAEANCMIVLHDDDSNIDAGQFVDILLFDGLI